jgi:hypothetical protein
MPPKIDTNILTRSFDDQLEFLSVIEHGLIYLLRFDLPRDRMASVGLYTMRLFPREAVRVLAKWPCENGDTFSDLVIDVMNMAPSVTVAAECLLCVGAVARTNPFLVRNVEKCIELSDDGRDLFVLSKIAGDDGQQFVSKAYDRLSTSQRILYDFLKNPKDVSGVISSAEFKDWPLTDVEFLRLCESVCVGEIELDESQLSPAHLRFISKHLNRFSASSIEFVKAKYPSVYLKLFRNPVSFKFDGIGLRELRSSAVFSLIAGSPVHSAPLLTNFFRFSKQKISQNVLESCVSFLLNQSPASLEWALVYAMHREMLIEPVFLDQINEVKLLPVQLRLAEYFHHFKLDSSTSIRSAEIDMIRNPCEYFSALAKSFNFRSRELKLLCAFLHGQDIPVDVVGRFISRSLDAALRVGKMKRLLYFLRAIQIFFSALCEWRKENTDFFTPFLDRLLEDLGYSFVVLKASTEASLHRELSGTVAWMLNFKNASQEVVDLIDSFNRRNGSCPIYFLACAESVSWHGRPFEMFEPSVVSDCLKMVLPSRYLDIIRSVIVLLRPGAQMQVESYFSAVYSVVFESLANFANHMLFEEDFRELISLVLQSRLSKLRDSIMPRLRRKCGQAQTGLGTQVLKLCETKSYVALPSLIKNFVVSPSLETGTEMIRTAKNDGKLVDCLRMFIANIGALRSSILMCIVVFKKLVLEIDSKELMHQNELLLTMIDSLDLGERGLLMKKILKGEEFRNEEKWDLLLCL